LAAIDRRSTWGDVWEARALDGGLQVTFDTTASWHGRVERWVVEWTEITDLAALKQDCFSYDTIWLRAKTVSGEEIQFPEDAVGFDAVIDALPRFLNGCAPREQWFPLVANPPLVEKSVELFSRTKG